MEELIARLIAIKGDAKNIHYTDGGVSFYGKHLLADAIQDPIDGYIDSIKEVCLLGRWPEGEKPKKTSDYEIASTYFSSSNSSTYRTLQALIEETLTYIEKMDGLTRGEENLVGAIAEHLQKMNGLLNLQNE